MRSEIRAVAVVPNVLTPTRGQRGSLQQPMQQCPAARSVYLFDTPNLNRCSRAAIRVGAAQPSLSKQTPAVQNKVAA